MPKKKPDHEKAKKISFSIPREDWELAEIRMFHGRKGPSEYIRDLIKADTQELWQQKHSQNSAIPFPETLSKVAEDTPNYGIERPNATVPHAQHSSVCYSKKGTKKKDRS